MSDISSVLTLVIDGDSGSAQEAASSLGSKLDQLGHSAGEAGGGAKEAGVSFNEFGNILGEVTEGKINPLLAAVKGPAGILSAVAGLGLLAGHLDTELLRLSSTLGISTDKAHELSIAFEDVGSNGEDMIRAGTIISNVITRGSDAIERGAQASLQYRTITDTLGISVKDANGQLRSQGEILEELLTKLGNMTNKTDAARIASEILGSRFAANLIPAIVHWNQVSGTAANQAKALGDGVKNAEAISIEFNTALTTVKTNIEAIAVNVLPLLVAGLKVLEVPLEVITKGFGALHTTMGEVGIGALIGFAAFGPVGAVAGGAIGLLADRMGVFKNKADDAADGADKTKTAIEGMGTAAGGAYNPIDDLTKAVDALGTANQRINSNLIAFDKNVEALKNVPTEEVANYNAELAKTGEELANTQLLYDQQATGIREHKAALDADIASLDEQRKTIEDQKTAYEAYLTVQDRDIAAKQELRSFNASSRDIYAQINELQNKHYSGPTGSADAARDQARLTTLRYQAADMVANHQAALDRQEQQRKKDAFDAQLKQIDDKKKKDEDAAKAIKNPYEAQLNSLKETKAVESDKIAIVDAHRLAQIKVTEQLEAQKLAADGLLADENSIIASITHFLEAGTHSPPTSMTSPRTPEQEALDLLKALFSVIDQSDLRSDPAWHSKYFGGGSSTNQFRAGGGPVHAGQPYVVGEEGPELFVPRSSGSIVNHSQFNQQKSIQVFGGFVVNMNNGSGNNDALKYLLGRI